MKGNIEDTAARVHDLIPHEYELNTRGDMQELIHQCKYEGRMSLILYGIP